MKVHILSSQEGDWEGLFIDGNLIQQHHSIGRIVLLEMAEKHNFKKSDIEFQDVDDEDEKYLYDNGCFPNKLEELSGNY